MRPVPPRAVELTAAHEGCRLQAYQCPAKVWTIGYGHTGPEVVEGLTITKAKAREYLAEDLRTAASRISANVKREVIDALTENQYAALLSFVFNVGANPKWTLWKRLNARQFDQVPLELIKFVNAGGKKVDGLVRRRTDEIRVWSENEPGSTSEPQPSSVTRREETPPTPAEPKPIVQSKTIWTASSVAAVGVIQGATQVQAIAAPQATNHELIAKLVGLCSLVIVAAGIAIAAFKWLDHKAGRR